MSSGGARFPSAGVNRQLVLAARPVGLPRVSDFQLVYSPLPSPGPGAVLVRSRYLALDPHLRPRMDVATAARPLALGEVVPGAATGWVVQSQDPDLRVGDAVEGMFGWQEHAVVGGRELRKVGAGAGSSSALLGVLGLPGLTAYFGLLDVAELQRGETVVVSGATGAIGMVAGQIARLSHCRVVGLALGDGDLSWLHDELGFDAVIGCTSVADLQSRLAEVCPDGIDVYFDTVGGATTDAVMRRINPGARIAACGQTSQDNLDTIDPGPRWLGQLICKEGKIEGFSALSYAHEFPSARARLEAWFAEGELRYREDVVEGIEAAPQAFIGMLRGERQGIQLVRVGDS